MMSSSLLSVYYLVFTTVRVNIVGCLCVCICIQAHAQCQQSKYHYVTNILELLKGDFRCSIVESKIINQQLHWHCSKALKAKLSSNSFVVVHFGQLS